MALLTYGFLLSRNSFSFSSSCFFFSIRFVTKDSCWGTVSVYIHIIHMYVHTYVRMLLLLLLQWIIYYILRSGICNNNSHKKQDEDDFTTRVILYFRLSYFFKRIKLIAFNSKTCLNVSHFFLTILNSSSIFDIC